MSKPTYEELEAELQRIRDDDKFWRGLAAFLIKPLSPQDLAAFAEAE